MPDTDSPSFDELIRKVARYLRHEAQKATAFVDDDDNLLAPGIVEASHMVDNIIDCRERIGRPPITWTMADDEPDDPREDKDWPEDEDCPGCDGHKERGPHRFGCSVHGKQQLFLPAKNEDGTMYVTFPIDVYRDTPFTEDK